MMTVSLEGGVGEASVQVGVEVSSAQPGGTRVCQHRPHGHVPSRLSARRRPHQLPDQVDPGELVAMGTAADSDPRQAR